MTNKWMMNEVLLLGSLDAARGAAHHAMSRIDMIVEEYNAPNRPIKGGERESLDRVLLARKRLEAILEEFDELLEGWA